MAVGHKKDNMAVGHKKRLYVEVRQPGNHGSSLKPMLKTSKDYLIKFGELESLDCV